MESSETPVFFHQIPEIWMDWTLGFIRIYITMDWAGDERERFVKSRVHYKHVTVSLRCVGLHINEGDMWGFSLLSFHLGKYGVNTH